MFIILVKSIKVFSFLSFRCSPPISPDGFIQLIKSFLFLFTSTQLSTEYLEILNDEFHLIGLERGAL